MNSPFMIRYGTLAEYQQAQHSPGTLYFITSDDGQCAVYLDAPVFDSNSDNNNENQNNQNNTEQNNTQSFSIISQEDKQKIEQIVLPPLPGEEVTDTETDSFLINYEQYQKLYDLRLNDSDSGGTFYAPVLQGSNGDLLKSNGDKTFSWVSGNEDKQALLGIDYEQNRQYLITSSEKDNIAKLSNILKLKINGINIGDLSQELNIYDPGLADGQNYFLISNNSNKPSWSNDIKTLQPAIGITYRQNQGYLITDSEKNNIAKLPQILKFSINGSMIDTFDTTNTHPIYAPTSSGNEGDVLISDNPNAPIWKTLAEAGIQSNSSDVLRGATKTIGIFTNFSNEIILASGNNSYYLQADYNNTHKALLKAGASEASLELDNQSNNGTKITGGQVKLPLTGNIIVGNSELTSSALTVYNTIVSDSGRLILPSNGLCTRSVNGDTVTYSQVLTSTTLTLPSSNGKIKFGTSEILTSTALTIGDSQLTTDSLKINGTPFTISNITSNSDVIVSENNGSITSTSTQSGVYNVCIQVGAILIQWGVTQIEANGTSQKILFAKAFNNKNYGFCAMSDQSSRLLYENHYVDHITVKPYSAVSKAQRITWIAIGRKAT